MRNVAFEPCIPTRGTKVPAGPDWLHEIKHDGYRLIVVRDGARVRLFTRNGHDWTGRYPLIVEAALRNRQTSFVIDGEAVLLGVDGHRRAEIGAPAHQERARLVEAVPADCRDGAQTPRGSRSPLRNKRCHGFRAASLATKMPSADHCLISWSQSGPDGTLSALTGRAKSECLRIAAHIERYSQIASVTVHGGRRLGGNRRRAAPALRRLRPGGIPRGCGCVPHEREARVGRVRPRDGVLVVDPARAPRRRSCRAAFLGSEPRASPSRQSRTRRQIGPDYPDQPATFIGHFDPPWEPLAGPVGGCCQF